MTGTFLQPNHETQSGAIYKGAIDNSIAVLARIGAMFAPHEQDVPNMTVRLDAGALLSSDVLTEVAAQNTATITAPVTNPRIDRVVIDALTGVVSVIGGTEAAVPAAPAIPTGKLPVCQVALATSTTEITNTLITDERIPISAGREAFPVNYVYQNKEYVNPATELGYGTWEELFLVNLLLLPTNYPPAQNATYVKATTEGVYGSTQMRAYNATNPLKQLTGNPQINENVWVATLYTLTNQRFHIDLGAAYNINRIYYENFHGSGGSTIFGVKNFTFWGSNDADAFAELTYGTDTNWTQLTTDISQMLQHIESDAADPHYINVTNPTAYRYYAFKFADTWGSSEWMGITRIELQTRLLTWLRTA